MPTPKFRTSASKRDMRRSHDAIKAPGLSICPNCQEAKRPHVVCGACGMYAGRQVLQVKKADTTWDGNTAASDTSK